MHIVVIGAGEVGSSIAADLSETHDIVVVDLDPDRVESLTFSEDVLAIEGDGTSLSVLEEAGLDEADIVIACTDDDETNLVACSTAKVGYDPFTIARVRNTSFLETWHRGVRVFNVDFMVCTNLLTAESIVRMAGLPAARDVDTFAEGIVQMAEFEVAPESPIATQRVSEADQYEALTFAGMIHEGEVIIPDGDTVIEGGARLVVIGTPESLREFASEMAPEAHRTKEVVIIGGDAIGEETARLFQERGLTPRLIDNDEDHTQTLAERLSDTVVMCHDATDVEFLIREHVDKADLVVVSLDSDERTLLASLLAKQIGSSRTVAVVETGEYVQLFEAVGIDVAINPREVTAEEITRFTREQHTENVALIESDQAEVIEVEVTADSPLAGRPIKDAVEELPAPVVIGAITRAGAFVTPRGETVVEAGDHVVILVSTAVVDTVLDAI